MLAKHVNYGSLNNAIPYGNFQTYFSLLDYSSPILSPSSRSRPAPPSTPQASQDEGSQDPSPTKKKKKKPLALLGLVFALVKMLKHKLREVNSFLSKTPPFIDV
jgi:hypothetical protein